MSDLISRSALLKKLESMTNDNEEHVRNNSHQFTYKELAYIICNQPTAYDKEAVVEQLEELKNEAIDKWDGGASHRAYIKALEIVKAGGIDE